MMPINMMYHESLDGDNIGGTVGKNGESICKIYTKSRKEKSLFYEGGRFRYSQSAAN